MCTDTRAPLHKTEEYFTMHLRPSKQRQHIRSGKLFLSGIYLTFCNKTTSWKNVETLPFVNHKRLIQWF